ncbi:hypothetical protein T484DRAFT_1910053, partial [Baffinella frigidus]
MEERAASCTLPLEPDLPGDGAVSARLRYFESVQVLQSLGVTKATSRSRSPSPIRSARRLPSSLMGGRKNQAPRAASGGTGCTSLPTCVDWRQPNAPPESKAPPSGEQGPPHDAAAFPAAHAPAGLDASAGGGDAGPSAPHAVSHEEGPASEISGGRDQEESSGERDR